MSKLYAIPNTSRRNACSVPYKPYLPCFFRYLRDR